MSTERTPLLSDEQMSLGNYNIQLGDGKAICVQTKSPSEVRDLYEAARAKDAELIQMAVDAMAVQGEDLGNCAKQDYEYALEFLAAAKTAGFTPTPEK